MSLESPDLGLNSHHSQNINSYLAFCREQRSQGMRTVASCIKDIERTRLFDETFSREEVEDLLGLISESVSTEFESELLHWAHSNCVILTNVFNQAQRWHLDLEINTADAENHQRIAAVRRLDETNGFLPSSISPRKKGSLAPLMKSDVNKGPPTSLLEAHIQSLKTENEDLTRKLHSSAEIIDELKSRENNLESEVNKARINFEDLAHNSVSKSDEKHIEQEMLQMRFKLEESSTKSKFEMTNIQDELVTTNHELKKAQAQLQLAEKELDKKLKESSAYLNIKRMLTTKNEKIKKLRRKLLELDPNIEDAEDE